MESCPSLDNIKSFVSGEFRPRCLPELTVWPSGPAWTDTCLKCGWGRGARRGSERRGPEPSDAAETAEGYIDPEWRSAIPGTEEKP